ncbi:MAG: hypothetical protein WKG00_02165 [Polyangiaceae bacterium]
MSTDTSSRTRRAATFALVVAGTALALACNKSEAAPAAGRESTGDPVESAPAAGPKQESETFIASIAPAGDCSSGKECTVEVTLVPKGAYHINDQYPTKWKVADPAAEGVTYPKPLLKKEDGKFEAKKGTFRVPFVAAKAGKAKVAGTLSLSVCSDANCIMEKAPLEIEVAVR